MKETGIDWRLIRSQAARKVVLCADSRDRIDWIHSLSRALDRDSTYLVGSREKRSELLAIDTTLDVKLLIEFYSTNQWSWADKTRGIIYDEILITGRGQERMVYPENLDGVVDRIRRTGTFSDMSLYLLTQNDPQIAGGLGNDIGKTTALGEDNKVSLAKDFDFPGSLFRRDMIQYFEDFRNPSREEFLFALTMGGVHVSTAREKAAIDSAKIYVEGKGH